MPKADPLIRTKLRLPFTRSGLVSRPRLQERIAQGLCGPLTLLTAPAGFGKTTLVASCIANSGMPAAWLSLDKDDNQAERFLNYLVAALQEADHTIGDEAAKLLAAGRQIPSKAILTSLINDLDIASEEISLVLDDYQFISSQAVHEQVVFLLEHCPKTFHLVIAARSDPPLPLARLRARGQAVELRAIDLRFTKPEATQFLNDVMGLRLDAESVAVLEERTEGWIAGLQMAALSIRGRDAERVDSFIRAFAGTHRFIMDFMLEEVLAREPEEVQTFLLQTAILTQLTGPLCDAVTGVSGGQEMLERLERRNLFVVPLNDDRRQWYRYHHLFADLLRQRLGETEPDRMPQLHRRAAEWFASQGLNREALQHSLAAKDYQHATDLLKALALEILEEGEHAAVSGWINALPENLVKEQPYLCVIHAWTLHLTGQFEAAEARLSDAEAAMANLGRENDTGAEIIRGHIHSHRAYLTFVRGEHAKTIIHARQALEQLLPEATAIRAQTALYLGVAYRHQGELQAALDIFTEAVAASEKTGGSFITTLSFLNLAGLYTDLAHLHQARSIYEQALQFTERHTGRMDMPFTGSVYVGLGSILRQWNELDDAYRYITKGIALDRDWNVAELLALNCIDLAHIHQALGNDEQAHKALQEAKQIFASFSPWGVDRVAAYQARLDLARGDVESAARWAQASHLNIDDDFKFYRDVEYLALARVFIGQNRFEQALSLLGRLYQITRTAGKMQSVLEILVLQAIALSAQGHTEPALIKLEQAFVIGEPENYVRLFVDEGKPLAKLLRQATSRGLAPEYVSKLLAAFGDEAKDESQILESLPSSFTADPLSRVEPLSERELEILRLFKTELSGPEIACELMISLSTVRTHTKNIYGKLGAHNRRQAVARAENLGLL